MLYFYPYNAASKTCKALVNELGNAKLIKRRNSKFKFSSLKTVINWGSTHCPFEGPNVINNPVGVIRATNKISTLELFDTAGVPCPAWTTHRDIAQGWAKEDRVIARHYLRGHGGAGIEVLEKGSVINQNVYCPLWAKYFRKDSEYRVIVLNDTVIDTLIKVKRNGAEKNGHDEFIRSHGNYWVFARNHHAVLECPPIVKEAAIAAVRALGLDFGGVDVAYRNNPADEVNCAVFEVNTAPGMEGTTLVNFARALKEHYDEA